MAKYYATYKGDGKKEELTREEWAERIGKEKEGLLELLETGGGINHDNKYATDFFIYEVDRKAR